MSSFGRSTWAYLLGAGVVVTGAALLAGRRKPSGAQPLMAAQTINRPIEEVFDRWRQLEQLPAFMRHIEKVEVLDAVHSRWTALGPLGRTVTWEAEMVTDERPHVIAWRSVKGAPVEHAGTVTFSEAPGHRGTEVRVMMRYTAPLVPVSNWFAKLWGEDPQSQVREDLRCFKMLLEAGEIARLDGQPTARITSRPGLVDVMARGLEAKA